MRLQRPTLDGLRTRVALRGGPCIIVVLSGVNQLQFARACAARWRLDSNWSPRSNVAGVPLTSQPNCTITAECMMRSHLDSIHVHQKQWVGYPAGGRWILLVP
jgi:hypothetical protein